ncbi:Uncharacterised nucleotidyltransferase [Virgibacillus subterraneus]|uniref:Uncharacterized nucleotidyltransferase n=1 Tax=Virgibacillus subterraneus TaxID=621109 RepID=A0A1H8ZUY6_9BACI|nr:nucleotidyltransferase family protein [Virgibacillus subterraneus]SEP68135.1 Uncharacterised nucleotidyltransferase [Virgibacillus subterraneus]
MVNKFKLDLTAIPKELQLIFMLLKSDSPAHLKTQYFELLTDIDWDQFIDLTMHHRVYPVLSPKLKQMDDDIIPLFVKKFLNKQYKRNTFQMLYLSGEMERVGRMFADDHIPLIFLKGPVLAHELYGDISLRTSSDLDMLIPINQLEKAETLLTEQGYQKDDYIQTVLNDWKWRHHHVTYFHPQKKIKLEVHWRLNPGPGKEPSFNDLWKRKCISNLTSFPVHVLSKEDMFLFLVSHGARHGWSRMRWLLDIRELLHQQMDWQLTKRLLKKYQLYQTAGQPLILVEQLLDKKLTRGMKALTNHTCPKELAQKALFYYKQQVNLHTDPVPEAIASYHKHYLFSLMSTQQKLFFMMSFLYPYPEDESTLPLPKTFHFLYFPLRPFLWVWRKTRKHALP